MSPVVSSATASVSACSFWTVWGLVRYTRFFEVAPKEIFAAVHVRWSWRPGHQPSKGLWKPIRQPTATKHHSVSTTFRAPWMTRIVSFCNCFRHRWFFSWQRGSNKLLLADCTPHSTFCSVEWRSHDSVWLFRVREPCVFLVHRVFVICVLSVQ
jgi:hypothetical protein